MFESVLVECGEMMFELFILFCVMKCINCVNGIF